MRGTVVTADPWGEVQPALGPREHLAQDPGVGAPLDHAARMPDAVGGAVGIAAELPRLSLRERA